MKETAEKIDVGKLGGQFGIIFRKLRPKVEESLAKPRMQPLYEKLEEELKHEFGDSLTKKDMLNLLTFYLVMNPVQKAIYSVN